MTAQRRVHDKPIVYRRALARGTLTLRPATLRVLRAGRLDKGDARKTAEIAGMVAMKRTPELIPHCHIVPLTGSRVEVTLGRRGVTVEAEAEATHRTGVEMEALVGATVALLTVWDMVKYLEKDAHGGYPVTRLGPVRVVRKEKRPLARPA